MKVVAFEKVIQRKSVKNALKKSFLKVNMDQKRPILGKNAETAKIRPVLGHNGS